MAKELSDPKKRNAPIQVNLTDAERDALDAKIKKHNEETHDDTDRSKYVRKLILKDLESE